MTLLDVVHGFIERTYGGEDETADPASHLIGDQGVFAIDTVRIRK